jgi:hypothetical protein
MKKDYGMFQGMFSVKATATSGFTVLRTLLGIGCSLVLLHSTPLITSSNAAPIILYQTDFSAEENYDLDQTLVGQNGWFGFGSGGNGLDLGFFDDEENQHAFIGFSAPNDNDNALNVWQPLNYDPLHADTPLVNFSVRMRIDDSTNDHFDDFRWSVYNANPDEAKRLFTLDFDNTNFSISYALDDEKGFVETGKNFELGVIYKLRLEMDYSENSWDAFLNEEPIATHQKISTTDSSLTLGSVDAVWSIRDPSNPGDNFMVFDDYLIEVQSVTTPPPPPPLPPELIPLGFLPSQGFLLRLIGSPGRTYAIEFSTTLSDWNPIRKVTATEGSVEFLDSEASQFKMGFYRAVDISETEAATP